MVLNDVLATLRVVLNGIPQALLAATYGFASIPTAFGFIIGAVACLTIGANIAFGNITASMTGKYEANIDHLTI